MRGKAWAAAIGMAVAVTAGLSGCGIFGGKHEVGECVRTNVGAGGTDIETIDCPAEGTSPLENIGDPVYRISYVLDYESSCPSDGTWGGIELKHEPDDAVYCLDVAV